MSPEQLRLQVFLARAGIASRRGSEELIRDGRVRINDEVAELGSKVTVGRDIVTVNGRRVAMQQAEWVALHKPKGYVTTRDDPGGRRTIYDLIPEDLHHLFHVGRLDRDSTGLILLTNDGDTANLLLHPRYGTTKEYLADVEEHPDPRDVSRLVKGVEMEDGIAQAVSADSLGELEDGLFRIRITMKEGRRREVRRMLDVLGYPVKRLFRRRFASIEIGQLRSGRWRYLTDAEVERLRTPEGEKPAKAAAGGPVKRASGPRKRPGAPRKRAEAEPRDEGGRRGRTAGSQRQDAGPRKRSSTPRKRPARPPKRDG